MPVGQPPVPARPHLPLNALRSFEAAARRLSFTQAGEELGVSQVAISRQVKALEQWLGTPLFIRGTREVRLTPEGARLLPPVRQALDLLALAAGQVSRRERRNVLSIQAYTTFAQRWLIPRLTRFHERHPDIEVRLTASVSPVDFEHQDVDAAVRSGDGSGWPGLETDFLTPIALLPVASSTLLKRRKGKLPAEALSGMTLLHSLARPNDWEIWLQANGAEQVVDSRKGLKFESSALAYEAALQGSGVAMGIQVLVEGYLTSGALVSPFGQAVRRPGGYYLVRPRHRPVSTAMRRFRDWILAELGAAETGG
ncbi:LysR substrate-binding domain-containing protein [Paracraurococcus lichenis]|uniref:LysR substrate-binding domain-containing protein n=1 Tax=Paracraurococcus lichenis TaxID=3064888 RepID=A0ABT9EC43_9PROT|nr:LysR substrate-binding domain-containing protein [Paracraurococcus sp. LOR1-02]MDO9713777.1 LysR substrate-binding domain-containing protein [Paracraurococcus sp. LOR1-02]